MSNELYKVAVYGTLRQGNGNNILLSNSNFLGKGKTLPKFEMFSLGGFPGITEGSTRITVEVYEVDSDTLSRLDRLEGYRGKGESNFYDREVISTPYGNAMTYTLRDKRYSNQERIVSGDWEDRNKVKLKDLI